LHEGRKTKNLESPATLKGDEIDEEGRYHCRHDDELHDYFDYQDYEWIDKNLKTCGADINWVAQGKVGKPK
jgi:hypothetical protein